MLPCHLQCFASNCHCSLVIYVFDRQHDCSLFISNDLQVHITADLSSEYLCDSPSLLNFHLILCHRHSTLTCLACKEYHLLKRFSKVKGAGDAFGLAVTNMHRLPAFPGQKFNAITDKPLPPLSLPFWPGCVLLISAIVSKDHAWAHAKHRPLLHHPCPNPFASIR